MHYHIDRTAIARMVQPGGMVNRFTRDIALEIKLVAKEKAPVRSGRLVSAINSDRRGSTASRVTFRVYIDSKIAPYGNFVESGTTGPITAGLARNAKGQFTGGRGWLPVGKSQGHITTYKQAVRGQRAQHFLRSAMEEVIWLRVR